MRTAAKHITTTINASENRLLDNSAKTMSASIGNTIRKKAKQNAHTANPSSGFGEVVVPIA